MNKRLITVSALGVLLSGCTMIPEYERPAAPVSAEWPMDPGTEAAESDIPWRAFFEDARLQRLIELSLENNRDLRVAVLRVEQTRAQYRIRRGDLFPDLTGNISGSRQRTPETVSLFDGGYTRSTYDVSLGSSWEVDLFGRVRSLKEQALQRYFAAEAAQRAAQIALVSEVAAQYLTLLQLQEARALAMQTLKAVEASFNLNQRSFQAGVASELDFRTAEGQVQAAAVNVATIEQLLSEAENALVLLIGQPIPKELPAGLSLYEQPLLKEIPVGVPSEVLQRRPDILAAEHNLKAANANIGAARAAFFPRILLTGSAGTASASLTDLFTGPSFAWSFAPQITVPIFQGGQGKANLDAAKAGKGIEVATYEKAIQTAFREVADALAARDFIDQKVIAQEKLVRAQQKRFDLTSARYREGVDDYVAVLLAQQDLYAAQQNLLQFQAARLMNAVTLYRSLGGGWKS